MKKTLLLSIVASTMIMAGGDIAPVEPVVETPAAVAAASGWDFNGQSVVYYQTTDAQGTGSLFEQASSAASVGLQLGAANKDLFYGVGAGFEVSGLTTLGLHKDVVSGMVQNASNPTGTGQYTGAALTQAYLTYGIANTSIKVGRQTLPKSLAPFTFSEGWNVFKNTFETALIVNSDVPDTTLVYALVGKANSSAGAAGLNDFNKINANGDVVHMLTAQNKSIDGLALTGSYYYAPDYLITEDVSIIWGDAGFNISDYSIGLQGGTVLTGEPTGTTDTVAFGAKAGANFGMFDASVAYSSVDDGTVGIRNLATSNSSFSETALYTQMLANVNHIARNNDTFVVNAGVDVLGGNLGVAYGYTTDNQTANSDYTEIDVAFKTNITENTSLLAAYIYTEDELDTDPNNIIRVWGRYNF